MTAAVLSGRVVVLTGASRGIGRAAAAGLARLGARVVAVCRREADGLALVQAATGAPGTIEVALADLARPVEVRRLAAALLARHPVVHVLVNNAGVITRERQETEDGLERQFAVNHLAPFVLTNALLPALHRGGGRVVTVSSEAHRRGRIDFDDLQLARGYRSGLAYANTKLMNLLFTAELARRLHGTAVTANALHPGVVHTGLLDDLLAPLPRLVRGMVTRFTVSPAQGADTILHLAAAPEVGDVSGRYFVRGRERAPHPSALDGAAARRLWAASEAW